MTIKQFINSFKDKIISADGALDLIDKVIIFGAGNAGRYAKNYLEMKKKEVLFFCDNDPQKQGMLIDSIKVLGPQKLSASDNYYVCIASDWAKEIALQLKDRGIKKYFDFGLISNLYSGESESCESDRWKGHFNPNPILNKLEEIENVYNLLEDERSKETLLSIIKYRLTLDPSHLEVAPFEHYYNPRVSPEAGDAIVDAGAWIGDTALSFAKSLDMKCKILSFEPETGNYNSLVKKIEGEGLDGTVTPIKAGLWSDDCHFFLHTSRDSTQHYMSSQGNERVDLLSLDNFLNKKNLFNGRRRPQLRHSREGGNPVKINLIKMDIEGAELEALTGAKKTITQYSPKLQVCVYHKVNDLWDIPLLIKSINPQYKFYLGHHSQILFDTILYAAKLGLRVKSVAF